MQDDPVVKLTPEDVLSNKRDQASRKQVDAERAPEADKRETLSNSARGAAKNKRNGMTQEFGSRRSKRNHVGSKTRLNYADDSDDHVDNESDGSETEELFTGRDSAVPCRRNPTRAKRANRYISRRVESAKENASSGMSRRLNRESSTSVDSKLRAASALDSRRKGVKSSNFRDAPVNDAALTRSSSAKRPRDVARTLPSSSCRTIARLSVLGAIDRLASREVASRSTATSDGYVCRSCAGLRRSFPTFSRLAAHLVRCHRQLWSCSTCKKRFSSRRALHCHRRAGHVLPGLVGRRCAKSAAAQNGGSGSGSFSPGERLRTRKARSGASHEDSSSYNKCGWCGQRFECRSELLRHRDEVHRRPKEAAEALMGKVRRKVMREWSCSEKGCNEHFKVKDKLREHMALVHPSVVFSCPECRFKTQVEHFLRR
jgi:hypothetical protein